MARHVDPPWESLDQLPTPLTDGERQVTRVFHQRLPEEWEMYVQPHMNGLRPDIVLLHPRIGVAVFEVKGWNLLAMEYFFRKDRGRPILMARDKNGKEFAVENPIDKIRLYKEELFELYCPRLDDKAGRAVITAGLIFPASPSAEVERVFTQHLPAEMTTYRDYYPIVGAEQVASGKLVDIFPESRRTSSKKMSKDAAEDLRGWLREPFFSRRQRRPLKLDARQLDLATTRTDTGYRRIKGPAGSGKSVVLAARASELASQGKSVLVASYNITLLNYLRDLAVRHDAPRPVIRRRVEFLNFHYWCKRICAMTGYLTEYKDLWRRAGSSSDDRDLDSQPVLNERLPFLVRSIYSKHSSEDVVPKYDAILVDEGQDFLPLWWQTLKLALAERGEMMLVADKTQNVYGTAGNWTDTIMANAGFRGPWTGLTVSYRLPPAVVPLVTRFAEAFLTDEEADVPEPMQLNMEMSAVELRWVQVGNQNEMLSACDSEFSRMWKRLRPDTAAADITLLSGKALGRQFVERLEAKGIRSVHTFDDDRASARRQKRAFFQGDARIKATTVHSFKGWEARQLIVCVESIEDAADKAVLYTALTRLLDDEHGSCLTVVSNCPALREYGKSWPNYYEV